MIFELPFVFSYRIKTLVGIFGSMDWMFGKTNQKSIFVLGTGRSGTHWLGHTIEAHPDVVATIEKPEIFEAVTAIAVDPSKQGELYPKLLEAYQTEIKNAKPKDYLDKSHPLLWFADDIAKDIPSSRFVAIKRQPLPVVASMLNHAAVRAWCENWQDHPVPNQFLGVTEGNRDWYAALSLPQKCAVRWAAHIKQIDHVRQSLNDRCLVVRYEDLMTKTDDTLETISSFLELASPIPVPEIRQESATKWRKTIDDATEKAIYNTLEELEVDTSEL